MALLLRLKTAKEMHEAKQVLPRARAIQLNSRFIIGTEFLLQIYVFLPECVIAVIHHHKNRQHLFIDGVMVKLWFNLRSRGCDLTEAETFLVIFLFILTDLNAVMMEVLPLLKLARGVVFVCWQELALVHVVDRRNGQVERETTFFIQAVINATEIVNRLDGNDRCHVQWTVGMFHKTCFMVHGVAVQVMATVSLDRWEKDDSFKK